MNIGGTEIRVYRFSALVAGSGAAGLNAADTLYDEGLRDMAIVTENLNWGTSRNTGSDKQTYYKLSLAGAEKDSVRDLAGALFSGGAVDGDIALAEAASSVPCFMKLVRLGIPFPKNQYGEFVGYKTDHDPARRATSAGPYTSKFMTEALEAQVLAKKIPVFNHMQILRLLTREGKAAGILCLDLEERENPNRRFVVFESPNIVWATGGPAAIYGSTVYPESQHGASGAALEAGALGRNLTEWQYGLASIWPRWNVSGTFMQVLPRFISLGEDGGEGKEFLFDYFPDAASLLSRVFLKGYQWPFDVRKLEGSSIIDILVYREKSRGRRVFLDFRSNPGGVPELDYAALSPEARDYLSAASACFGTPVERLIKMNKPAYDFFLEKGTDLRKEPLEIALSAQHNNGGLAVDHWWRSNIEGLFPAGEAAATHGVYRPGGSALNAGQAGSFRATSFIAHKVLQGGASLADTGDRALEEQIRPLTALAGSALEMGQTPLGQDTVTPLIKEAQERMAAAGGVFRDADAIRGALETTGKLLANFSKEAGVSSPRDLPLMYRLRDILITQFCYLSAMEDYISQGGKSRGSALYRNEGGRKPLESLPEQFRYLIDDGALGNKVQELRYQDGVCQIAWREVRPIPEDKDFFEKVWSDFREHGNYM